MITIKVAEDANDYPKLLSFPLGVPNDIETMQLSVEEKISSNKKRKRKVKGELDDLEYCGIDYDNNSIKNNLSSYAIGVLDEETNEMTLYPAGHVFVMRPHFPQRDIRVTRTSNFSYAERRNSLTTEFGSKKRQRALKAEESNTILTENITAAATISKIVREQVEKSADDEMETIAMATEKGLEHSRINMLPFYDINATEVEYIYPLERLIPQTLSTELISCIQEYMTTALVDATNILAHNSFEANHSEYLSKCPPETRYYMRAVLNHAEKLINFDNMNESNYPMTLFTSFIKGYMGKTKLSSKHKRDIEAKLKVLYILATCMRIYTLFMKTETIGKDALRVQLGEHVPEGLWRHLEKYMRYTKVGGVPSYRLQPKTFE